MQVYLVNIRIDLSAHSVVGVFSTYEKAREYIKDTLELCELDPYNFTMQQGMSATIGVCTLDQPEQ